MAKNTDRHEFRFVVDGLALDDASQSKIAFAVQQAGLTALSGLNVELSQPVILGHSNLKLRPEWYGLWVINGRLAATLGPKIQEAAGLPG